MSDLMQYEKETPRDFYETKTHLWIMLDGKIRKRKAKPGQIHRDIWGEQVWSIECRGYYNEAHGLITCHDGVTPSLAKLLAKKFPTCVYYRR